jgi:cellulose synthase/poly-beta-1,6-N-acetylglucosamine synthase-like glycosyltransferase
MVFKIKTKNAFLLLFFLFVLLLDIFADLFLVSWQDPISFIQFLLLLIINLGLSFSLTELILSLFLKKKDLPKLKDLKDLEKEPAVALLYVTYNDADPKALLDLKNQTYKKNKIFILDDSTDEIKKTLLDNFENEPEKYKVIRRPDRTGFKAGALNNWIEQEGKNFEYFVILDSDSWLKQNFIEEMLRYSEHTANCGVAVFQSKTEILNPSSKFAGNAAVGVPIWMHKMERLANDCDMLLPWGHNNLFRTRIIEKLGFETSFVSEDFATDLKIIGNGYQCKLVDVTSYEGTPQTIRSFTKRTIRWSSGALQLIKQNPNYLKSIPFSTGLYLFWTAYFYLIWVMYIPGMFLSIWGYQSNINSIITFFNNGSLFRGTGLIQILLILFYVTYFFLFNFIISIKAGTARNFIRSIPLNAATSFYIMIPLVKAQLNIIIGNKPFFEVTEKNYSKISLFSIIKDMRINLLFAGLLILGIIRNPVALLFNWFWFLLFVASPFIIYYSQGQINILKE